MSKPGKDGRVPASKKEELDTIDFSMEDDHNMLALDSELKKVAKEKGITFRWINATKYKNGGNFHKSGWRAYRHQPDAARGATDFEFGVSPEGYVIRNDLMLAYKKNEDHARWGAKIARLTKAQSGSDNSRADELREAAGRAGVKVKVHDGYEEN